MPRKGHKKKKLEWEKYKFDTPEGTWKKRKGKKKKKKKKIKLIAPPGPFRGSVNLHKLAYLMNCKFCVQVLKPPPSSIRQNKQNENRSRNEGEEAIFVIFGINLH